MTKTDRALFIPLLGLFIAVSCIFSLLKSWLTGNGVDHALILSGNFLVFLVTAVALLFHIQGFHHKNPNVFLRSVYASLLVKMFVFAGAVLLYALLSDGAYNKAGLFICMALYFVYTFLEVKIVFRLLKQNKSS